MFSLFLPLFPTTAEVTKVSVGKQQGALTEGSPGTAVFSVTADDDITSYTPPENLPSGAEFDSFDFADNSGTLTLKSSNALKAGRYPLTFKVNGVTSDRFELSVNRQTYRLTINCDEGGTVDAGKSGYYAEDDRIIVTAQPLPGYMFSMWTTSNGGSFFNERGNSTNFVMPANDTTVTAHFFSVFSLDVGRSEGGVVTAAAGLYKEGDRITLQAVADEGYVFDGWKSSGGGSFENPSSPNTAFVMPAADVVITGIFSGTHPEVADSPAEDEEDRQLFSIATRAEEGGFITADKERAYEGDIILLVAVPNEGYAFECWSSSGGGDFADAGLSSTTFIMPACDVTITAVFTKIEVPLAQAVNFEGDGPGSRSNGAVILIAIAVSLAVILAGILLALYRRSRRFLDDDAVVPEDSRETLPDSADTDVDFFGGGAAYDEPESDDGLFLNAHASFFDGFDDEPFDHGVDSGSSASYTIETVDAFDDTGHEPSVFGAAELPEPEDVETSDGGDTNSSNADITE
ncbi:MAG: InlB B-repeat-containing protein, partial [Oscillospiraceae bacterium]|nr:InlB B-repeat-containing protein [Oscillospiraceae bacterium]